MKVIIFLLMITMGLSAFGQSDSTDQIKPEDFYDIDYREIIKISKETAQKLEFYGYDYFIPLSRADLAGLEKELMVSTSAALVVKYAKYAFWNIEDIYSQLLHSGNEHKDSCQKKVISASTFIIFTAMNDLQTIFKLSKEKSLIIKINEAINYLRDAVNDLRTLDPLIDKHFKSYLSSELILYENDSTND